LRRLLLCALAVLAVQAAGGAGAQRMDAGQEAGRQEPEVALPAYPAADGLIEFAVGGAVSFRFFVDPASIALEPGGVVRYTLVARSPSGIVNVTHEGMRCIAGEYRVYAYGNDGRWSARPSDWRRIEPRTAQRWHNELHSNYFCPLAAAVLSVDEAVRALRRGGHPAAMRATERAQ